MDAAQTEFAAYYREHYPAVARFAERRIDDRDTAAEIAADVFRIVWGREGGPLPERAWLLVTARNLLGNAYRGRERRRALEQRAIEAARAGSSETPDAVAERELIAAVFEAVGPRHTEVLRLAFWDGLPAADLGLLLGCSANAAAIRVHRARRAAESALARIRAEEGTHGHD